MNSEEFKKELEVITDKLHQASERLYRLYISASEAYSLLPGDLITGKEGELAEEKLEAMEHARFFLKEVRDTLEWLQETRDE